MKTSLGGTAALDLAATAGGRQWPVTSGEARWNLRQISAETTGVHGVVTFAGSA